MREIFQTWIFVGVKVTGALGGAVVIGGLLYFLLGIEENRSSQIWVFDHPRNMIIAGSITYGLAFVISRFLARHKETQR